MRQCKPGSVITHPAALRNKTVAVNFHAGSHYLALQMLEGFMEREEIKVVHMGQARLRLQGMLDGTVDAAMLMEPFIAAAEKLDCTLVMEGFYAGSEMLAPDLDAETVKAINATLSKAVDLINANKKKYLPLVMADAPDDLVKLTPEDFKLSRLRYVYPRPYPAEEFQRTYEWMRSWDLIPEGATYESLVDNRVAAG
jgi:NitT/TauT family transport system substrate-binding protein